jgi:5-(carboxyamino)imidazole ribonucleotide synthase
MPHFNQKSIPGTKLGILGGGQLGKMLLPIAHQWDVETWVLDPSNTCSCAEICHHFVKGDFNDYETVYQFGQHVDVITIEIEHVNTEALLKLQQEGKRVFPEPKPLDIIKDKGLQKLHYQQHAISTSPFQLFENKAEVLAAIEKKSIQIPFVQKSRKAGYDGKGVLVVTKPEQLNELFDEPSMVEQAVNIKKEISVIAARNLQGEVETFPVVEMTFNPIANLVEFLICPAQIPNEIAREADILARKVMKSFELTGLLAVELFLTQTNELIVNEVAPRPHNSGHQSIEGCLTSQYEQHLRAILGLPLGNTTITLPSVMVNLLGEPNYSGKAKYEGFQEAMNMEGVKIHLYGKTETRPYRKMGHVTVLDADINEAIHKAKSVQNSLKIKA